MTARGHPNRASLHKLRDPVNDRILHERLQEQWGHGTLGSLRIAVTGDMQTRAEPHLFDGEEPLGERPFISK
jgi:hypothetical protein